MTGPDITDPETGGSRLLSEQCSTCIFRPGNLMRLRPGKLKDLVEQTRDTYVVCHDTLECGEYPDYGPAMCRGFYDKYGDSSFSVRLLKAYERFVEVPPPC